MLRVASIIPSLAMRCGGPIINLVDSVSHLRRVGIDLTIFTTDMGAPATARSVRATPGDFPAGAADCDIRMFRTERPGRLAYAPQLRQALRSDIGLYDLARIHGLFLYPQYAGFVEAQRHSVPYIVTPHGSLDPWVRRHGRARKVITRLAWQDRMLRGAAAIHATTHAERDLFRDVIPHGPAQRVVSNGVSVKAFRDLPRRGALRAELGIGDSVPLVLFLGRLSRKKGLDVLVRAVAQMDHHKPELVIVGPDDENLTPELVSLASESCISPRVHFVGPKYDIDRLSALADADVWALPSHTENFGNAVLEAMAAGVPTVISPDVNLAAAVVAAGAGCVAERTPAAFARECARILSSPREQERLRLAGPQFAARYDWERVAQQLAGMFREFAR